MSAIADAGRVDVATLILANALEQLVEVENAINAMQRVKQHMECSDQSDDVSYLEKKEEVKRMFDELRDAYEARKIELAIPSPPIGGSTRRAPRKKKT
jgi:hypothetical protein